MYREHGNPPIGPKTEGEKTNPADDLLIADSGEVPNAGLYECIVSVGASAAADVAVQRRNAANAANVGDVVVLKVTGGNQTGQYRFLFKLEASERIRVIMDDALTGTIAAAVNLEQYG